MLIYNDINILIVNDAYIYGSMFMTDINQYLKEAVAETKELNNGEIFLLRDLFKGYEWNRISRSNRLLLGTLFLNRVSSENLDVKAKAKASSGQQKYQIVREA